MPDTDLPESESWSSDDDQILCIFYLGNTPENMLSGPLARFSEHVTCNRILSCVSVTIIMRITAEGTLLLQDATFPGYSRRQTLSWGSLVMKLKVASPRNTQSIGSKSSPPVANFQYRYGCATPDSQLVMTTMLKSVLPVRLDTFMVVSTPKARQFHGKF